MGSAVDVAPSRLRATVRDAYSGAARDPTAAHPFPVGRAFAESLGYPALLLDTLPTTAVQAFAGVSNVSLVADLRGAAQVLDLGCGAGLDSLVAARRLGSSGRVLGIDFSEPMLERARAAVDEAGARNVDLCRADAERLPLPDGSIDVALVNGLFNLNPARHAIFGELARVVAPGGTVVAAELILSEPLPPSTQFSEADWFA